MLPVTAEAKFIVTPEDHYGIMIFFDMVIVVQSGTEPAFYYMTNNPLIINTKVPKDFQ